MAEAATTATTSETTSETTEETTDEHAGAETQAATTEAGEKTFTQAELNRIVKQRLAEEKKRLDKAASDAQLPEIERLKTQIADHEKEKQAWAVERRDRDTKDMIIGVVSLEKADNPYRAKNPVTVYKLIKDDLVFDDDGKATNYLQLLKSLKAEDPTLFGPKTAGSVNGGDGSSGQPAATDMNAMIRQHAGRG